MKKVVNNKWLVAIIVFFISSFFLIEGLIIMNGKPDEKYKVDYLVILGSGLHGEILSPTLLDRMEKALEFIKKNSKTKIVVSGGQGKGETISEAEAMKRYLILNGVTIEKIIKEDQSTSTLENLKFTKKILKKIDGKKIHKIMIVSNDFHLFRAKFIAKRNGFVPYGLPSKTISYIIPKYYIREYFAVWKSFIFDR